MAKELKANEGMYLYNGESVVKVITIANEADEATWQEVSQEFYDEKNSAPEPEVTEAEVVE